MNINEAVIKRIEEIRILKQSNICDICLKGGMSPSNIYDIIKGRTKHSKINTLAKFCDGAGISLSEFSIPHYSKI